MLCSDRRLLHDIVKQRVTLRLKLHVLADFREDGPGQQGRINAALRATAGL
ncbi:MULTISPECIES: BrnA antitoxin family protein [Sphingomonas]|uniref:BrnA antitoxin family protein n=1 Tax=Sphingomonas TaxID=13687 RepID=UPI002AA2B2F6|nr:BrnA antitoxin family protein [Sphingomonas sp. Leaf28]